MIDIEHPASASERGWGAGWPDCQPGKMERLDFPGFSSSAEVRAELRELMVLLLTETESRGYLMHRGAVWCWAFACRDIKRPDGTTTGTPSNHSWGLALDINAPRNPNQSWERGEEVVSDMPTWVPVLWNTYGFRWGGDYPKLGGSTADAMHFEFCGTPTDARELTEKARADLEGSEMGWEDFKKGVRAHKQGKEPDRENADFMLGYNLRDDAVKPGKPATPRAHDHTLTIRGETFTTGPPE